MITKGMMSSNTCEWETPQWLFDHFDKMFDFDLDVCATEKTAKVVNYFTKDDDGLQHLWSDSNWMNPPYGREVVKWVKKAYEESLKGNMTVCLLPARPDTRWWHDYVMEADVIHFIKGRLKFGNNNNSAPFPSCIAIFGMFNYERVKTKGRMI